MYSLGDDGNWGLQQKLLPTNSDSTANKFGNSVATSGNIIVVGADLDDSQGADSGTCFGIVFSTIHQNNLMMFWDTRRSLCLLIIRRCLEFRL